MLNRNKIFALGLVGTLSLFSLVGCSSSTPEAAAPADSGTAASSAPADSGAMATGGYSDMSMQVASAKTAVEAGNFDEAKTDMGKVEDAWKTVEDDLKKKDQAAYDTIETHMGEANAALKGASPDAAMVSEHLTMLEGAVTTASTK